MVLRIVFCVLALNLVGCALLSPPVDDATTPQAASSERVNLALATLENLSENLWFLGYQSVEEVDPETADTRKYMLLDFHLEGEKDVAVMQASVKQICTRLYENGPLIQDLGRLGYEQIAVSFEDTAQYECI